MVSLSSSFLPNFHATNVNDLLIYDKKQPSTIIMTMLNGKQKQPLLSNIFKPLDDFVSRFMDSPLQPYNDPKQVLAGNFAPVDELPPTPCEVVEGALPSDINGAYIRVGPNPQFIPHGPYHIVDGDGMLQSIKISKGQAVFCSRYVKTYKYTVERDLGYPIIPNAFSSFNGFPASLARGALFFARVVTGQVDPITHGYGTANTSLALVAGHLMALWEADLPYALEITSNGDIVTLGRYRFTRDSNLFSGMTAHPKIDPETGETFAFSHNPMHPFLTYFKISPNGIKYNDVQLSSLRRSAFIHDFAVTKNYAIFPDIQYLLKPTELIKGNKLIVIDKSKEPRLGILPRYAENESQIWWVDVPGFNLLHTVNAWEENGGNTIVIIATNVLSVEHLVEHMNFGCLSMEKITIDVRTKSVERHPLSTDNLDFGAINPAYRLKKTRYIYASMIERMPKVEGVVKMDLSLPTINCTVASRVYGAGCYGGEPMFEPREPNNPNAEEDDGYLVTYVHDENSDESKFLVMDTKSASLDIVAVVRLPQRVPYGFHGIFVPDNEQKNGL